MAHAHCSVHCARHSRSRLHDQRGWPRGKGGTACSSRSKSCSGVFSAQMRFDRGSRGARALGAPGFRARAAPRGVVVSPAFGNCPRPTKSGRSRPPTAKPTDASGRSRPPHAKNNRIIGSKPSPPRPKPAASSGRSRPLRGFDRWPMYQSRPPTVRTDVSSPKAVPSTVLTDASSV